MHHSNRSPCVENSRICENAKTEPSGNRNMKAKQTTVDKFTNSEIEELKRQLMRKHKTN